MKAVILAGGFSTRLYPLTEHFPKALLKVGSQAIVQDVFDQIAALLPERNQIALVTNHHYKSAFAEWLTHHDTKQKVNVVDNAANSPDERLGAVGDLLLALKTLDWLSDDVLVVASDTLTSLRIADFIADFETHHQVLNAVFDCQDLEKVRNNLGQVTLQDNTITHFIEKPPQPTSTLVSIPYYLFPKSVLGKILEYASLGLTLDAPGSLLGWLVAQTTVKGYLVEKPGYYFDVGTPEQYQDLLQHPPQLPTAK